MIYGLPEYPEIYKYGYYCYANIEGKKIIKHLINHRMVDPDYTYPNNINEVTELFGIEAGRYYLVTRYNMNNEIAKIVPSSTDLLADFQTATSNLTSYNLLEFLRLVIQLYLLRISRKYDCFWKICGMGRVDGIKGVSSCIITDQLVLTELV